MIIYMIYFFLVIAAIGGIIVPVIATCYLYYVEKRVGGFKFLSLNRGEVGNSALENKLIKTCFLFWNITKVCALMLAVLMVIRILTR